MTISQLSLARTGLTSPGSDAVGHGVRSLAACPRSAASSSACSQTPASASSPLLTLHFMLFFKKWFRKFQCLPSPFQTPQPGESLGAPWVEMLACPFLHHPVGNWAPYVEGIYTEFKM